MLYSNLNRPIRSSSFNSKKKLLTSIEDVLSSANDETKRSNSKQSSCIYFIAFLFAFFYLSSI